MVNEWKENYVELLFPWAHQKWSINVEPVQCETHNKKNETHRSMWNEEHFDQISIQHVQKIYNTRGLKIETKQDAPSIQLLPHILHEIARTYVYAIELSIHTTISTRKLYSLFFTPFQIYPIANFHRNFIRLSRNSNVSSQIKWIQKLSNEKLSKNS